VPRRLKKIISRIGSHQILNHSLKGIRKSLPFILLLVITGTGIFWVHQSLHAARILELEGIKIIGIEKLNAREVIAMTGFKKGLSLLSLDLTSAVQKIGQHPRVHSVGLRKIYPNQVEIRIQEREAFLQIFSPRSQKYFWIDRHGFLLPEFSEKPTGGYLIYEDLNLRPVPTQPGKRYASFYLESLADFLDHSRESSLFERERIKKVSVDELGFWTFVTEEKIEFRIGEQFENLEKLENFGTVLHSEVRNTLRYLDLRFQDVVVKIKQ